MRGVALLGVVVARGEDLADLAVPPRDWVNRVTDVSEFPIERFIRLGDLLEEALGAADARAVSLRDVNGDALEGPSYIHADDFVTALRSDAKIKSAVLRLEYLDEPYPDFLDDLLGNAFQKFVPLMKCRSCPTIRFADGSYTAHVYLSAAGATRRPFFFGEPVVVERPTFDRPTQARQHCETIPTLPMWLFGNSRDEKTGSAATTP